MHLKAKHIMQLGAVVLMVMTLLALARAAAADDDQNQIALPGCNDSCGDVKIPYPFGIGISSASGNNCSLEETFDVTCNASTSPSKLSWGNIPVLNISLEGWMELSFFVSKLCKNDTDEANEPSLTTAAGVTVSSSENEFITVGCNNYGYLKSFYNGFNFSTGCLTRCYGNDPDMLIKKINGNCSGVGCCQVDIPPWMKNITVQVSSFSNFTSKSMEENCGYSFIAKRGSYKFSTDHLRKNLPNETFPLVVDWTVGNLTCKDAMSRVNYACKNNSFCDDKDTDNGYRCRCKQGYQGNPYHPHGCTDVDECKTNHSCISELNCLNTDGSHTCFCPKGYSGNGTKEGGCQRKEIKVEKIVIGASAVVALFMATSWIYLIQQRRKLIKLKEKFFRQNGGQILQQHLSTMNNSSQTLQIFTEEKLKKATKNYDESLIIGRGGYGTVFKGLLTDNRVVAVKKSRVIDQSQIKPFINEVVLLSQINHRNVVKLLGCCLETEVPTLVYEYVDNGTLFDHLFNENKASSNVAVSWKTRLRIAVEAAGALSYLHSAASIPIIHRDVKSANILLDHAYTAKVSDFGASRLVPLDQAELPTVVQGTMGYLDPESMQTSQITEKSDVYSFGVVLVELLTGQKAFVYERPEEKRNIAIHFLRCLKEECLFEVVEIGILNEENKEEIKEVAVLASKCLCLKGEERPSMKEVALELEGIRVMDKHSWVNNAKVNFEETQKLLHEANSIFEHGNSSSHQNAGYDSLRDLELIVLDDGR